jgi:hypothetical protein
LDYKTWINVENKTNNEFGKTYATITRPQTQWRVTWFYIGENVTSDPNKKSSETDGNSNIENWGKKDAPADPCNAYHHAGNGYGGVIQNVGQNCFSFSPHIGPLNNDDDSDPKLKDALTPDTAIIDDAPPGTKFCIGLSVMDYTSYIDDDVQTYGDGMKNWWYHLEPECVSISKVPTMQVWGGGLYTGGISSGGLPGASAKDAVIGRYAIKKPALYEYWQAFGSWSEYDAIGSSLNGNSSTIKLFGSAAALGHGLDVSANVSAVGSGGSITNGCAFTKLHVANWNGTLNDDSICHSPESATTGNSTAFKGMAERVALRYTGRVQGNQWVTGDTAKVSTVTEAGYTESGAWNGNSAITPRTDQITYYHYNSSATIPATTIGKGKTVIVEIEGTATITGDITYTTDTLSSINDIPQVLIFANDIDIAPQVTQIDAWLMVGLNGGGGVINTCANGIDKDTLLAANGAYGTDSFMSGTENNGSLSRACNNRLKINGPVQAKKLKLLRSYGAGMGLNCPYATQWPNGGGLGNCGGGSGNFPYDSATPAEVFNLRADAYLWAYRQTENYSQAFVTYQREVAPRW